MRLVSGVLAFVCAMAASAEAQDRMIDAHSPGYIPVTVPATVRMVVNRRDLLDLRPGLDIYVTPNIVPETEALALAASRAAAYCRAAHGSDRVKFTGRARHSAVDLESWAFRGHCGR